MLINDKDIMKVNKELRRLRAENVEMKEKLDNYIPRRRVRRVFKSLKAILEADIQDDNKIYLDQLKEFIQKTIEVKIPPPQRKIKVKKKFTFLDEEEVADNEQ